MWAQFAKAQRRRYLSEQSDHVQVFDPAFGVRVVLAPQAHELVQMMRSQNRPIARQIIEIVHNDGHEQIDNLSNIQIATRKPQI